MLKLPKQASRRLLAALSAFVALAGWILISPESYESEPAQANIVDGASDEYQSGDTGAEGPLATEVLDLLAVKGKAPATGYTREEFYTSWGQITGCDMRNVILKRDMTDVVLEECIVKSGTLQDPYTGAKIEFVRGENSSAVQIDHVVALADAWKKGAQNISKDERYALANDPLNLLAVDGPANSQKGGSDAASWLPKNKAFRCQYVARQISVKYKYALWVTSAEKDIMMQVLEKCPNEKVIGVEI